MNPSPSLNYHTLLNWRVYPPAVSQRAEEQRLGAGETNPCTPPPSCPANWRPRCWPVQQHSQQHLQERVDELALLILLALAAIVFLAVIA